MSKKKEMYAPLTRWQYFTKTLYHDPSKTQEFEYDGVIYLKSQELQDIEERNAPDQLGAAAGAVRHVPDGHQVAEHRGHRRGHGGDRGGRAVSHEPPAQGYQGPPDGFRTEEAVTEMKIIARIRTELPEKFGVPRQSGWCPSCGAG